MGMLLNPGNGMFQKAINSDIYVDKSGLIKLTNDMVGTQDCMVCVSRPRRFGKTMALNMLAAYYGRGRDSRAQFEGLEIAAHGSFEKHLNRYDVIKLTMTDYLPSSGEGVDDALARLEAHLRRELAVAYPDAPSYDGDTLPETLGQAYEVTGTPFVFLIDEWDCVMREMEGDEVSQKAYLDWLRGLLKDREYVALAYATGILPVRKYGLHSALNMFDEVSVLRAGSFAPYTGFTKEEVDRLCEEHEVDVDEMHRWYDGYDVGGVETYNPRSVVMAVRRHQFGSYWTQTETYEALRRYIVLDMDGLRGKVIELVGGAELEVNIGKFQNTMNVFAGADDVLTLLVHLGYLTYSVEHGTVRVPNSEVAQEFVNCLGSPGWEELARAIADSNALMDALAAGDAGAVAAGVQRAHQDNASVLAYNDENSLACAVSIALYAARRTHTVEREVPAGKGFADLVYRPRPGVAAPAMVVELKTGGTAQEAVAQIREKGYADALAEFPEVLLVGIAYDPDPKSDEHKEHRCVIERA